MWRKRVQQFGRALDPPVLPWHNALAAEWLLPAEFALFQRLAPYDRMHSAEMAAALLRRGLAHRTLMAGALLHDLGKSLAPVSPLHRALLVLLDPGAPKLLDFLGSSKPGSWRYPFWVLRHHADLGAQLAAAAGVEPRVVALIRDHHRAVAEADIQALQLIDSGGD